MEGSRRTFASGSRPPRRRCGRILPAFLAVLLLPACRGPVAPHADGTATGLPPGYELAYGPSPFLPAEPRIEGADRLAPDALGNSVACGSCHVEIYRQWQASLHRAAATDVFSRFAIDRTAENYGRAATRLCVACHDPGALLAGLVDRGFTGIPPTRVEGVSCLACHLVTSTHPCAETPAVANGSYTLTPVDRALLFLPPDATPADRARHAALLKRPFLSENRFCDACHRFFLPTQLIGQPTGRLRLQSEEAMGTPFGDPSAPGYRSCVDCHMPKIAAADPAAKSGLVHDHRSLGANTLIPTLEGNPGQAEAVAAFRRDGAVTLGIGDLERTDDGGLVLPVVLRNQLNGHDFPTGATDISEAWGELELADASGTVVFRSPGLDAARFLSHEAPALNTVVTRRGGDLDFLHDLMSQVDLRSHPRVRPGGTQTLTFPARIPQVVTGPLTARVTLRARHGNELWNRWVFNFEDVVVPVTDLAQASRTVTIPVPAAPARPRPEPPPATPPAGMALIPGGTYTIGADPAVDPEAAIDEFPPHPVSLQPFYLDRVQVTNAAWAAAVGKGIVPLPAVLLDPPFSRHSWKEGRPPPGLEDHPVTLIPEVQAANYCRGLGKRLPTEAEWEAAARGHQGRRYAWGDTFDPALCNTAESGREMTLPVGSLPANATPEGVLDLGCNVPEWVGTPFHAYPTNRHVDNRDEWYDHYEGEMWAVRGAGYELSAWRARASTRTRNFPERFRIYGFRCALDAGGETP